jgi:hypothetical protein
VLKKIVLGSTALLFAASLGLSTGATRAYANKVDCGKVMAEVGTGKKASEIAKDMNISTSSVYRCKKKAKMGMKGEPEVTNSKGHHAYKQPVSPNPAATSPAK